MHAALEELDAHVAGRRFLALGNGGLEHFALGRKPIAVVDELGIFWDERVAQVHDFAIHGDGFDGAVRVVQDGAAGRFVDPAVFHAGISVLDDVDAADGVLATQRIELVDQRGGAERFAVDGDRDALLETDFDIFSLVLGLA